MTTTFNPNGLILAQHTEELSSLKKRVEICKNEIATATEAYIIKGSRALMQEYRKRMYKLIQLIKIINAL